MAKWQASQGMKCSNCHELEIMSLNPSWVKLGVCSTFVLSHTWTKYVFPGIGHPPLEESHLPLENTTHTSCKYADSLSHSSARYPSLLGRQRQYGVWNWMMMTSSGNRTPDLLILSPMPYPPQTWAHACFPKLKGGKFHL